MTRALLILLAVLSTPLGVEVHAQAKPVPNDVLVLCYHEILDNTTTPEGPNKSIAKRVDQIGHDVYATNVRNLVGQFDWLAAHGYHVISLQQLVDANQGRAALPDRPVLLMFDDGLKSVYTKVFPLLKAYHFPAVVAIVNAWIDLPAGASIDYSYRPYTRDDFATWDQLREMQSSGLVEIASHTADLHRGILANPQGNLIPAATSLAYDAKTHSYETEAAYENRLRADLTRSANEIREKLGRAPRAIVWPYGEYTEIGDRAAAAAGMPISFSLDQNHASPAPLQNIPRLLISSDPTISDFIWLVGHPDTRSVTRAMQVDLDSIFDPDSAQQERNLSALLDRVQALGVTTVWLQAFADPDGSNAASSVYFPNRHLPMRADLFSRVAWQLRTRTGVQVYAWLPVLGWKLPDKALQQRLQIQPRPGVKPENPVRLNPFLPETAQIVGDLYEDLARSAPIAGILFNDDAFLRDTDQLGEDAPPPGPARTQALIQFTNRLRARAQLWRPELRTVRNLFAQPVLNPQSEQWYAQSLPSFVAAYDQVALMAMPQMENAHDPDAWLRKLARRVAETPHGLDKTAFELQSVDWKTKHPVPTQRLAREMYLLEADGVRHLAYYPDDFHKDNPRLDLLRPVFSSADIPVAQSPKESVKAP